MYNLHPHIRYACFMNCHSLQLQVVAFDELKTDYKNPIDQCNSLNPVSMDDFSLKALTIYCPLQDHELIKVSSCFSSCYPNMSFICFSTYFSYSPASGSPYLLTCR